MNRRALSRGEAKPSFPTVRAGQDFEVIGKANPRPVSLFLCPPVNTAHPLHIVPKNSIAEPSSINGVAGLLLGTCNNYTQSSS